jgi:serine/threonine-protein kinase RsbW
MFVEIDDEPCSLVPISFPELAGPSRLPTGAEAFEQIQSAVLSLMAARGHSEKDQFAMRLALEEALVNAARHGNRADPANAVRLCWEVTPELYYAARVTWAAEGCSIDVYWSVRDQAAIVAVYDEGDGFDLYGVPDPRRPENLGRPSARGLLLMKHYMTWVWFADGGRGVLLCRRRNLPHHEQAHAENRSNE